MTPVGLVQRLKSIRIEHELAYLGVKDVKHADVRQYLIEKLKEPKATK